MKYTLIDNYINTPLNPKDHKEIKNIINFSFLDGPKVEIVGNLVENYEINFIDQDTGICIYTTTIQNNMWCASTIKYYVNWKLEVKRDGIIIGTEFLNLESKKVKIIFDTQSMGDLIAYIGATDEFRKKHNCELYCVVFNSAVKKLLEKSYKNITFIDTDDNNTGYYAVYKIGFFIEWTGRLQANPKEVSLTQIAPAILGIGQTEYKPALVFNKSAALPIKKYVCISIQSTAQFKYWNRPGGWDEVVRYLKALGYEVWCIDRNSRYGSGEIFNTMPKGVIDMTGDYSLDKRLEQLSGAEFFIGISSGLSWLAWAVNIPVILISGIGKKWTEFYTPHRIINESVCNGCSNDTAHEFDKGNWLWCPRNKNFECSKQITPEMIIAEIDRIRSPEYHLLRNFNWEPQASARLKFILYEDFLSTKGSVYERFFAVENGDIVMDIGAHIGMFSTFIAKRFPKKIIAIEPSMCRLETLKKNIENLPITIINKGISDGNYAINGGLEFDGVKEDFYTTTFMDIIKENKLTHIDFLKIDCEGGEYDVFTEENFEWIQQNVKKIAGELHLKSPERKKKFVKFRDKYLSKLTNYRITSVDGIDIKWDLFNEHFMTHYDEVIFYIDNRTQPMPINIASVTEKMTKTTNDSIGMKLNVLITGISGGLGTALERECISRQIKYFGQSNEHYIKESYIIKCDFTNSSDVSKMEGFIRDNDINCLINNAGVYISAPVSDLSDESIRDTMNVNLIAPIILSKYLYKYLLNTSQSGKIININSLAGKYPNYSESVYCASKFGLAGFGASLSINQKSSKIQVIDCYIGAMKTNMTKNRENYNNMMDSNEIANFILDIIQSNVQYIASSIELRNTK